MMTLLAILTAAAIGLGLSIALRLPSVPLLILTGLSLRFVDVALARLGWEGLQPIADFDMVQDVLLLGLTFLVFAAGLELNPSRVMQQHRAAMLIGIGQFVVMLLIGGGVTMLFGMEAKGALHMALAVSASSTIVVVRILRQRRQFFEPFGRLVLGVLLLQDVIVILLIAGISGADDGLSGIVLTTLATLGLVLLTWVCIKWISPWLIVKLELDQESLLLVALAILFGFTGLAFWMQVPLVIGSFLAGVALSGFPVNSIIRGQLLSLNSFFLAMFFVALGAILIVPSTTELMMVIVLTTLIIIVTPVLVVILAEYMGLTTRSAIESGLLLAQSSEFSIVVVLLGVSAGYLEHSMLSVIALVTVLTMILTTFIATDTMTWRLMRWHPSRGLRIDKSEDLRDHIIMLGCGVNSRVLLDLLLLHGNHVVVVDEDFKVVQSLRERGIDAVRGDGADEALLTSIKAGQAFAIISTMRRLEDTERMIRFVGDARVLVRVFSEDEALRIKKMGGVPVCEAQAAADDFFEWFTTRFKTSSPQSPCLDR